MALKNFIFDDLALGLNTLGDAYELRPGESPSALNVLPSLRGEALSRRNGLTAWNTALPNTSFDKVDTIYDWRVKGLIVVGQGDSIKSADLTGTTPAWTTRFTGAGDPFAWEFELAKDSVGTETLWAVDGSDTAQKWNGVAATTSNWVAMPASVTCIRLWKNRMVGVGDANFPERVWYSPIGNPDGTYSFIDIRSSYDDSDPTVWAELLGDNLLVFKRNSTWLIYDINTFANRRLGYPGVPARKLSANLNGTVYFASRDNLWVTDGVNDPQRVDQKVSTAMNEGEISNEACQLIADPVQQRLLFVRCENTVPGDAAAEVIEYYPPRTLNNPRKEGTWWRQKFNPSIRRIGFVESRLSISFQVEYHLLASDLSNDMYFMYEGNTDNGTTIAGSWTSGVVQLSQFEKLERVRRCNVRATVPVVVTLLSPGATNFVATVSSVDTSGFAKVRPEIRGREFQVKVDSSGTSTFTLRDLELVFRGGKEKK